MKTLRIGIAPYEDMKARTMAIARGEFTPGPDEPKLWFTSIESLARVLSDKNRALIDLIIERRPQSLAELEQLSGRAKSNLSRTLKSMERFGLIELVEGEGRTLQPRVPYDEIQLDLPMAPAPDGAVGLSGAVGELSSRRQARAALAKGKLCDGVGNRTDRRPWHRLVDYFRCDSLHEPPGNQQRSLVSGEAGGLLRLTHRAP